jgi:hypothetical protein
MCFVCNIRNDRVCSKNKGPGVSIKSTGFRYRFQVDFVDYSHDPRKDHNGVKMKWIMTPNICGYMPWQRKRQSL